MEMTTSGGQCKSFMVFVAHVAPHPIVHMALLIAKSETGTTATPTEGKIINNM